MNEEPRGFQDVPVASLARELQARMDCPGHLDPERLAELVREKFNLRLQVTREDGSRVLQSLKISVNPADAPPTREVVSGYNVYDQIGRRWVVYVDTRESATRQTQTIFHELYEILRAYFRLWGGALPAEWANTHFTPERYARWFAGAVTMPRAFVRDFINAYGLDVPQLCEASGCSLGSVVRRLREVLEPKTSIAVIECAVPEYLTTRAIPEFRCIDSVRGSTFSMRGDRWGGRYYHLPRKRELWVAGPLVSRVVETQHSAFAPRVTGFDLFGWNDVSALAFPVIRSGRLVSIAIIATHTTNSRMFTPAVERLEAEVLEELVGLTGSIRARAPLKSRPRKTSSMTRVPDSQRCLELGVASIVDNLQIRWAFYEEDEGLEELYIAA